jgi:PAS domain S-box-containing protein
MGDRVDYPDDIERLRARLADAERRLAEANETLDAIRNGEVDAVVIGGPAGQIVYTLENADRPYRVLVEQMKEGAVTLGADGGILYCNRSFAELVGQQFSAIVSTALRDHVDDPDRLEALLAAGPDSDAVEIGLKSAGGALVPVNLSVVELPVEDDGPRLLCAIVTDLTENHARSREVAEANARLEAEIRERSRAQQSLAIALDASDMGSWELSLTDNSSIRSARHDAIFGRDGQANWTYDGGIDAFLPEDREAVRAAFVEARHTGTVEFEKRIRRANDGALRWIFVKGRALGNERPATRLAGILLDVTERRVIDEQLRQAQKMEAIGQLTGGVAHDFNNLLMIIGGSLESLTRRNTFDERGQRMLDAAKIGVARGAKLNQQLLAFARRQDMRVESVCINELLPDFETLLDRALGEAVTLRIERDPGLWHCSTDHHQLETAILNLAINSRDAMPNGGTLTLTTSNESVSAAMARTWEAQPGDYVRTQIADTGAGMSVELVARVFEPFFTTKGVGRGTGLGLSQVYGFAKQSGGFVVIDSVVGAGTRVGIYLPRVAPPRASAAPPGEPAVIGASDGRVLLVEDDPDVAIATRTMVEELGYEVVAAASSVEALEALAAQRFDIVFTDVIMATGTTGIELAATIEHRYPGMPVLLTSGYTAHNELPSAAGLARPLLHKPFTLSDLSDALLAAREGWRADAAAPTDVDPSQLPAKRTL